MSQPLSSRPDTGMHQPSAQITCFPTPPETTELHRSTPQAAEAEERSNQRTGARLLFVGESNTSRSVLAQAIFSALLAASSLRDCVHCESKVGSCV